MKKTITLFKVSIELLRIIKYTFNTAKYTKTILCFVSTSHFQARKFNCAHNKLNLLNSTTISQTKTTASLFSLLPKVCYSQRFRNVCIRSESLKYNILFYRFVIYVLIYTFRATEDLKTHTKEVNDWASFCTELDKKNLLLAPFCGDIPCEEKIKEESAR